MLVFDAPKKITKHGLEFLLTHAFITNWQVHTPINPSPYNARRPAAGESVTVIWQEGHMQSGEFIKVAELSATICDVPGEDPVFSDEFNSLVVPGSSRLLETRRTLFEMLQRVDNPITGDPWLPQGVVK